MVERGLRPGEHRQHRHTGNVLVEPMGNIRSSSDAPAAGGIASVLSARLCFQAPCRSSAAVPALWQPAKTVNVLLVLVSFVSVPDQPGGQARTGMGRGKESNDRLPGTRSEQREMQASVAGFGSC